MHFNLTNKVHKTLFSFMVAISSLMWIKVTFMITIGYGVSVIRIINRIKPMPGIIVAQVIKSVNCNGSNVILFLTQTDLC